MQRTADPTKPVAELPPLEWSPPAPAPHIAAPFESTTAIDHGHSAEGRLLWRAALLEQALAEHAGATC